MPDTVYRKTDSVVDREIAEETILVPIHGNLADMQRLFSVNPTGRFIWNRIDGEHSISEIAAMVPEVFDVTAAQAQSDALEFVAALSAAGLIEPVR